MLLIRMPIIMQIIIVNMGNMVLHMVDIMVRNKVDVRVVVSRLMEVMEDMVTMEIMEGMRDVKDVKEAIRVAMLVIIINMEVKKIAGVDAEVLKRKIVVAAVEAQAIVANTGIHILIATE